jgi:hypothetical protein
MNFEDTAYQSLRHFGTSRGGTARHRELFGLDEIDRAKEWAAA